MSSTSLRSSRMRSGGVNEADDGSGSIPVRGVPGVGPIIGRATASSAFAHMPMSEFAFFGDDRRQFQTFRVSASWPLGTPFAL